MTRPSVYVTAIRTLFGFVFVVGSAVHLRAAFTDTRSYGPFGDTAWPPLDTLWTTFVLPNIGWLAVCMAAFELAVGVMAWLPGRWNRLSVIGMTGFFTFLIFLGYAFPTATPTEDFLVNRLGSVVMIGVVLPWLLRPQRLSVPESWLALLRRSGHRAGSGPSGRHEADHPVTHPPISGGR